MGIVDWFNSPPHTNAPINPYASPRYEETKKPALCEVCLNSLKNTKFEDSSRKSATFEGNHDKTQ
jgi:hypothetical protein